MEIVVSIDLNIYFLPINQTTLSLMIHILFAFDFEDRNLFDTPKQSAPSQSIQREDSLFFEPFLFNSQMGSDSTISFEETREEAIAAPEEDLKEEKMPCEPEFKEKSFLDDSLSSFSVDTSIERKELVVKDLLEHSNYNEAQFFENLISSVREGILSGYQPELIEEGEGGSYLLRNKQGKRIAIFKPEDEDPACRNNPKNLARRDSVYFGEVDDKRNGRRDSVLFSDNGAFESSSSNSSSGDECSPKHQGRNGVKPGEAALREVAAYQMDHGHFASVPATTFVSIQLPKETEYEVKTANISSTNCLYDDSDDDGDTLCNSNGIAAWENLKKVGSLQVFVENEGASWDYGPGMYPVAEVHKIGVLDLRLMNCDRHGGNLLVVPLDPKEKKMKHLVPIDHGFSLPDNLSEAWFEWLTWPQAKQPFDQDTLNYISALDVDKDAEMLKKLGVRKECINIMRISTLVLQKLSAIGWRLYDIASLVCRDPSHPLDPSRLEELLSKIHSKGTDDEIARLSLVLNDLCIPSSTPC